jgi:hypothetical protein
VWTASATSFPSPGPSYSNTEEMLSVHLQRFRVRQPGTACPPTWSLACPSTTLYINHEPCPGARGCAAMLSRMLPEGVQLRVIGPNGYDRTFFGLPD